MRNWGRALAVCLLLSAAASAAWPSGDLQQSWAAVHDSLASIEPWMRRSWLAEHGLQDYYRAQSFRPDSQGLHCVGRWSYGPSVKVSLRTTADDTIICLARGSGASIIRFRSQDSLTLQLLSDIDCSGIVSRAIIRDTLVFCGMQQGGTGIEVWGVSDLNESHRLSYVYLPPIMDIAVQDTFLYATGYVQDSLRVFSIADPRNPRWLGACADSGFPMYVSDGYCYLADQSGLNILDVYDPQSPHRVSTIGGDEALSVTVRDTLCFFGTASNGLRIYNVKNPASPTYVGSLTGIQPADLYLPPTCDTVLYTPVFHAINIADPSNPRIIGQVDCPGWDYGVTAVPALNYALVADYHDGLAAVGIGTPTAPTLDTTVFGADAALDVSVSGEIAAIASYASGMILLDVQDPTAPAFLGRYDTTGGLPWMESAVVEDSFVFVSWPVERLQSIDITNPTRPARAGVCQGMFGPPNDMVLRDSLVYCAEGRRLQIVNVARPREPVLVGSCVLSGYAADLDVVDTFAYLSHNPLTVVNVARPDDPILVGTWGGRNHGVDAVDSIVYATAPYTGLVALSVASPSAPYVLDSLYLEDWWNDVAVAESLALVGGTYLKAVDVSNPRSLRVLGTWRPPYLVRRVEYAEPYFYVACQEAGVCVLETVMTGLAEQRNPQPTRLALAVEPNVVGVLVRLEVAGLRGSARAFLHEATGRKLKEQSLRAVDGKASWEFEMTGFPAGVYLISVREGSRRLTTKIVKAGR